jgi:hypothetical protein
VVLGPKLFHYLFSQKWDLVLVFIVLILRLIPVQFFFNFQIRPVLIPSSRSNMQNSKCTGFESY